MSISPGYTDEEIRDLVYAYERVPYGRKAAWLAERSVSFHVFRRWRAAVFGGDVEYGLVPRDRGVMSAAARKRRDAARSGEDPRQKARIAKLEERVRELEETNDALGKAIGLLHKLSEQEPAESPARQDPPDSSTPRTSSSDS